MILAIKKGVNMSLAYGLSQNEFDCKCKYETCTQTLVSKKLLWGYEKLRKAYGYKIIVHSAMRCDRHNHDVGGVDFSTHKLGLGIDLSSDSLEELYDLAKRYFDKVIKYDTFIHCDMRKEIIEDEKDMH